MPLLNRRRFLGATAASAYLGASRILFGQETDAEPALDWHDVRDWGVEGKGWTDTESYFDRLPARAKGKVRDVVWRLSRDSAGMLTRFRTDAPQIWVDYTLTSERLAMPHMPATGVSGVDLYAEDDSGHWRWVAVSRPEAKVVRKRLIAGLSPAEKSFTAYLPLYNGVESLKIGVPAGAGFTPVAPRTERPLVFYGTSITHGACASRPGMPHPAILGRRLNMPMINLGFSGNGQMEASVGEFLCELDPAVFIIDCLPNLQGPQVAERAAPLVRQLREARPKTPILLVEDRTYPNAAVLPERMTRHEKSRAELRKAFESLRDNGVSSLYYLAGDSLLGDDRDDTTDGSHPSDLGFYRQADAFEPVLRTILGKS